MGALEDFLLNANAMGGVPGLQPQQDQSAQQQPAPQTPSAPPTPQYGPQAQGIKGYLSNIFYNMGEAAKAHLGMPTDVQVQQQQQRINQQQQQIDADTQLKLAQVRQMSQAVTLPNGMQVPFALAKPYLDYQAKQYAADAGANAKVVATTIGKRFIPVPNVGMFDTQAAGGPQLVPGSSPTSVLVTDDIAKEYGIPDQLKGKSIPLAQFSQFLRGTAQFTPTVSTTNEVKEITGPDGNPVLATVPVTKTTQRVPLSQPQSPSAPTPAQPQGTTPQIPAQGPQTPSKPVNVANKGGVRILTGPDGQPLMPKSGADMVYAVDPKTNQTIATNRQDAAAQGLQITASKVNPTQIRKDQSLSNRLADVQRKVGDYADTFSQPLSDSDRTAIAYLLDNERLGKLPIGLPMQGFANNLLESAGMGKLSDAGMKRLIMYNQARESLSGYQQILTNSGHSSDTVLHLQLSQLPPPLAPGDFAKQSTDQFQQNLDLAGQHIPVFAGSAETQQSIKQEQLARRQQNANVAATQDKGIQQNFEQRQYQGKTYQRRKGSNDAWQLVSR